MDRENRVVSYKRSNRRLLDKVFELKPIKRGVKSQFNNPKHSLEFSKQMSSQLFNNNNNYTTTPTSPNTYISRKLNNMDQA